MQLHELKPKTSFKRVKRVGRGGKKGTYSGRGMKGQKSRAGTRFQPMIREWLKKYHKLRGYRFNTLKEKAIGFNLSDLEKNFESGQTVSPKTLKEKNLITEKRLNVKILGSGDLTKSLIIEGCTVSKKAREVIEAKQGEIK
ncbi:MAG: uL15 family ribosomal protein [Candidatus Pacebacteria bacterium]|nr:uL15 family ribosomal protein [Candidatus Paceibacterota bacterium]MDD3919074.1 uL15 family ribosomal protein [Candidatus Paceibacterota bacterium]